MATKYYSSVVLPSHVSKIVIISVMHFIQAKASVSSQCLILLPGSVCWINWCNLPALLFLRCVIHNTSINVSDMIILSSLFLQENYTVKKPVCIFLSTLTLGRSQCPEHLVLWIQTTFFQRLAWTKHFCSQCFTYISLGIMISKWNRTS